MRFAFALQPQTLAMPVVPAFLPTRAAARRPVAVRAAAPRVAPVAAPVTVPAVVLAQDVERFPAGLADLDLDQRVRLMGEW